MRIATELFFVVGYLVFLRLVSCVMVQYKKNDRSTVRSLDIPIMNWMQSDRSAHPEPLPTDPPQKGYVLSPYKALHQGVRYPNDTRVFRKRFDYEAMLRGQQITCQGLFDCILSYIAIESTEAIPVLLRGGAGYRHFTAVLKAKPHRELKGQVRAYCRSNYEAPSSQRRAGDVPRRRFYFGELEDHENYVD